MLTTIVVVVTVVSWVGFLVGFPVLLALETLAALKAIDRRFRH